MPTDELSRFCLRLPDGKLLAILELIAEVYDVCLTARLVGGQLLPTGIIFGRKRRYGRRFPEESNGLSGPLFELDSYAVILDGTAFGGPGFYRRCSFWASGGIPQG